MKKVRITNGKRTLMRGKNCTKNDTERYNFGQKGGLRRLFMDFIGRYTN